MVSDLRKNNVVFVGCLLFIEITQKGGLHSVCGGNSPPTWVYWNHMLHTPENTHTHIGVIRMRDVKLCARLGGALLYNSVLPLHALLEIKEKRVTLTHILE